MKYLLSWYHKHVKQTQNEEENHTLLCILLTLSKLSALGGESESSRDRIPKQVVRISPDFFLFLNSCKQLNSANNAFS